MITDLYYFGGYILLTLGAFLYGYLVMSFDISLKTNNIWRTQLGMALLMSFLVNALRIEQDCFSMVFVIFRDSIIYYLLFIGLRFSAASRMAFRARFKDEVQQR